MRRYVWGFPGVGKSSVSIDGFRIVDADAAAFQFLDVDGVRLHGSLDSVQSRGPNPAFPENYLKYIGDIDADLVMVNCHLGLLPDLNEVLLVYPDSQLKEEYLARYRNRGDNDSFVSYMAEEFEGMVDYLDSLPVPKIKIIENNVYLQDVLESGEFRMKVLTRKEIAKELQRAVDLGVVYVDWENKELAFDAKLPEGRDGVVQVEYARWDVSEWVEAVLNGEYGLDIDDLWKACTAREKEIERERILSERRGGLSREELEDKIMQGIVNGALGISYGQIAPYSHGYEVTFGGEGPVGSTRTFQNRWECYCAFFDIPGKIVDAIEKGKQDGRVFGADTKAFDIGALLKAIADMEGKKLQSFVQEKDTDFERWNVPYRRGSVAMVRDVHAGKGLDGIVQHHYHGDYSTMTPSNYNSLVERLVFMKGFCLDCLHMMPSGAGERQKVIEFLQKQGIDVSTPEKLRSWIRNNPDKCGLEANREVKHLDGSFYARAYSDFVQLGALVEAHDGSLDAFIERHGLVGDWYEGVFNTSFGALTDVYLYENEDGYVGLSDSNICIWDHENDVGEEDLLFADIKAKCEELGFHLVDLEVKVKSESNAVLELFELSPEAYQNLVNKGYDYSGIKVLVATWGASLVERGYDVFTCSGSDVVVEGALIVEAIGDLGFYESDFEACRQAEKDGVRFINDMDGLEKGCYLDTPDNRALCEKWLKEHPEYRVENWLDLNSDYGQKYAAKFGPVISMKDWKLPLALTGVALYGKWTGMYNEEAKQEGFDGTSSLEDRIHSVEDAAGWMLLTYEDTALEVIGEWLHDFVNDTCWNFKLTDIQIALEKCFGFERDFPTYEEIQEDYEMFVALTKDVRSVEQAIAFADTHHTHAEVNGDSAQWFKNMSDMCLAQGGNPLTIEWIRYDEFRCLSYVYDRLDGKPMFDVYRYDGEPFAIDYIMKDLTEEKYEEIVDKLREDFLKSKMEEKTLRGNVGEKVDKVVDNAEKRSCAEQGSAGPRAKRQGPREGVDK